MDELDDGACKEVRLGGVGGEDALSILIYRRGDGIRAFLNCCPHFSLPLNARRDVFLSMFGERVMCAWHCAVFSLEDGRCLEGPAHGMALESIPITVHDGLLRVAQP